MTWFCTRPIILDGFYTAAWLANNGGANVLYEFCGGHGSLGPPVPMPMCQTTLLHIVDG